MISVTGSVLVFDNELLREFTRPPIISTGSGPRLSDAQLAQDARTSYPGFRVVNLRRSPDLDQEVDIYLQRGDEVKKRMFDPRTGRDLGDAVPPGIRMVSRLLDLHDNLFGGETGRKVNGMGAILVLVLAGTGLVIWWPGSKTWRRSLTLPRGVGWKRMTWHLHSMLGFWSLAFTVVFALSGIYLANADMIQDFADWLDPVTAPRAGPRLVDQVIYWLAYLHFGRVNGIGIICSGPGFCDKATKTVWALFGIAPAVMFVTGAMLWWNRVLRPRWKSSRREAQTHSANAG